jgi:DNA-binding GntR family transcriptional regulator
MGEVLMRDETPWRIWDQHEEILDAVIRGDGPRAEQLARVQVTKTASVNIARLANTREGADRNGDRLRRAQLV